MHFDNKAGAISTHFVNWWSYNTVYNSKYLLYCIKFLNFNIDLKNLNVNGHFDGNVEVIFISFPETL